MGIINETAKTIQGRSFNNQSPLTLEELEVLISSAYIELLKSKCIVTECPNEAIPEGDIGWTLSKCKKHYKEAIQ